MPELSANAKEWIKDIGTAVVISFLILQFIKPTIVREHSMEPTLHESDYIFVSRQAYTLLGKPARGDIIIFEISLETPDGKKKLFVKRIIGLPGEEISISGGKVRINGEVLEEDYTLDSYTQTEMETMVIPENQLFVMGDNRQNSSDSRDSRIGTVSFDLVRGKAFFRLFPFDTAGTL